MWHVSVTLWQSFYLFVLFLSVLVHALVAVCQYFSLLAGIFSWLVFVWLFLCFLWYLVGGSSVHWCLSICICPAQSGSFDTCSMLVGNGLYQDSKLIACCHKKLACHVSFYIWLLGIIYCCWDNTGHPWGKPKKCLSVEFLLFLVDTLPN